jgi:hypothetical protein
MQECPVGRLGECVQFLQCGGEGHGKTLAIEICHRRATKLYPVTSTLVGKRMQCQPFGLKVIIVL